MNIFYLGSTTTIRNLSVQQLNESNNIAAGEKSLRIGIFRIAISFLCYYSDHNSRGGGHKFRIQVSPPLRTGGVGSQKTHKFTRVCCRINIIILLSDWAKEEKRMGEVGIPPVPRVCV